MMFEVQTVMVVVRVERPPSCRRVSLTWLTGQWMGWTGWTTAPENPNHKCHKCHKYNPVIVSSVGSWDCRKATLKSYGKDFDNLGWE